MAHGCLRRTGRLKSNVMYAYPLDMYFSSDPAPRRFRKGMQSPTSKPVFMVPNSTRGSCGHAISIESSAREDGFSWITGIRNWAMTAEQALDALHDVESRCIPILSGDVYGRADDGPHRMCHANPRLTRSSETCPVDVARGRSTID